MANTTIRTYQLYSYFRQVVVTGAPQATSINGDVYTNEQIVMEAPILSNYVKLRVDLLIDNTKNTQLYFLDPRLTCSMSVDTSRTDAHDIVALKRIYNTL